MAVSTRVTLFAVRTLNKRKLIFDVALIAAVIAVGLLLSFIIKALSDNGSVAVVSVNGEVVGEYKLSEDGRYTLNGGTNILVISKGEAYIEYADCPDGLCKNQGKISMTGERIVCLPNRVIIEIE